MDKDEFKYVKDRPEEEEYSAFPPFTWFTFHAFLWVMETAGLLIRVWFIVWIISNAVREVYRL